MTGVRRTWIRTSLLALFVVASVCIRSSPSRDALEGDWMAVDPDGRTTTRSVVRIEQRQGRLYGRIVRTLDERGIEIEQVCGRCRGDLKGRRYTDFDFIRDLKPGRDGWTDGTVIDLRPGPLQGTQASCDLSLQSGKAVLRGYLGVPWLGKTSTWERLPQP